MRCIGFTVKSASWKAKGRQRDGGRGGENQQRSDLAGGSKRASAQCLQRAPRKIQHYRSSGSESLLSCKRDPAQCPDVGGACLSQDNRKRQGVLAEARAQTTCDLPSKLVTEIGRLFNMGYRLVPLGKGADGRRPSTMFRGQKRVPRDIVLRRMQELGSHNYAVELVGLVVVDVDTDTPEAHAYVERRFGLSPFIVKSPKGTHYWYRLQGVDKPAVAAGNKIRFGSVAIDVKSGKNELIAGPHACRLDGGEYLPMSGGLPPMDRLPVFVDKEPPKAIVLPQTSVRAPVGTRNALITKKAAEFCGFLDTQEELFEELRSFRNAELDNPETFPDEEIRQIVRWAWRKRIEGKLAFKGRSSVKVSYDLAAELAQIKNDGPNAMMLYIKVQHEHGASRRWFSIDPAAMAAAKIFSFGRDAIAKAAKCLVEHGVLERREVPILHESGARCFKYEYRLTGKGEGFNSYIIPRNQERAFVVIEGGGS